MFKELVVGINYSTFPLTISRIKLIFYLLWPFSWSRISATFLATLTLCLSPFSSGGKRNVFPMRPAGSKVGIGLDPDGFSLSLDLMKTVVSWVLVENLPRLPLVIQRNFIFRRVRRFRNLPSMWCKPMVGSRRFLRSNCTSIDNFLGFMVQELVGHGITRMLPKASPVSSPLFTFRREMLVMCCIEHRLIENEKEYNRNI